MPQYVIFVLYLVSPVMYLRTLPIFLSTPLIPSNSSSNDKISSVRSIGYSSFTLLIFYYFCWWMSQYTFLTFSYCFGLYRLKCKTNLVPFCLGIYTLWYCVKWSSYLQFFFFNIRYQIGNILCLQQPTIQMFENSFFNRLTLRCTQHPKNLITHLCIDSKCDSSSLFCQQCLNTYRFKQKHYSHELSVVQINCAMDQISVLIDKNKKITNVIYRDIVAHKANEGLLKWQEEKDQHFTSIEKHINTIKFQVQEELQNIVKLFQQELDIEKQRLYGELEMYYRNYRDKFDKFAKLTEPIVALNNKYKFFASKNALIFKLSTQCDQNKIKSWLLDLKRTLSQTQRAVVSPVEYADEVKRYGQAANDTMDDLPRIRNADYQAELPGLMSSSVRDILHSFVKLKQNKPSSICRSISMNAIPNEQTKWKPIVNY